jgi:hypothetical protein
VLVVFFVDVTRLLPAVARVVVSCKTITLFMLLWLWSGGINSDSRSHKESGKAEEKGAEKTSPELSWRSEIRK